MTYEEMMIEENRYYAQFNAENTENKDEYIDFMKQDDIFKVEEFI